MKISQQDMDKELLLRYIKGDVSAKELVEITHWLEADEKNMAEFLAHRKLYDMNLWYEPDSTVLEKSAGKRTVSLKWPIEILKIAAVFIISFTLVRYLLIPSAPTNDEAEQIVMQTLHVPSGQRAELTLADGTHVWLNAMSTLKFPTMFSSDNREVLLDGEGYFDVKTDSLHPFIVKTKSHDIQALGTSFNVLAYNKSDNFTTALLEGKVKIFTSRDTAGIELSPNTMAVLENDHLVLHDIDDPDYFLWRDGIISFHNEGIMEIFKSLEKYYNVRFIVENKRIIKNNYEFTGKFRTEDGVDHILNTLKISRKFTHVRINESDTIILR